MKQKAILIATIIILTACSSTAGDTAYPNPAYPNPSSGDSSAYPNPSQTGDYVPSPADSDLTRDVVYLDSVDLLTLESFPLQFTLVLKGNLPTPCHKLKIAVSAPDAENKIIVDVYSVSEPDVMCAQVLEPFEVNFPLGSFPTGHYTLWINGKQITEFDA